MATAGNVAAKVRACRTEGDDAYKKATNETDLTATDLDEKRKDAGKEAFNDFLNECMSKVHDDAGKKTCYCNADKAAQYAKGEVANPCDAVENEKNVRNAKEDAVDGLDDFP